jgi:hypothetical protein
MYGFTEIFLKISFQNLHELFKMISMQVLSQAPFHLAFQLMDISDLRVGML